MDQRPALSPAKWRKLFVGITIKGWTEDDSGTEANLDGKERGLGKARSTLSSGFEVHAINTTTVRSINQHPSVLATTDIPDVCSHPNQAGTSSRTSQGLRVTIYRYTQQLDQRETTAYPYAA
jgi:hypothetical protein